MVSPDALARKNRFLALKEEHKNIDGIQDYIKSLKWNIWYDATGSIISASKQENAELDTQYQKAEFTDEQVDIVKPVNEQDSSKNWSLYKISTDKFDQSIKYLEIKSIEKTLISDTLHLLLVEKKETSQYNVKIKVNKNKLLISLHKTLLEQYNRVGVNNAVIKGRVMLPLYFTSKNDPSFLFYKTTVSLIDLITNTVFVKDIPDNLEECSIYTLNLFETYIRE